MVNKRKKKGKKNNQNIRKYGLPQPPLLKSDTQLQPSPVTIVHSLLLKGRQSNADPLVRTKVDKETPMHPMLKRSLNLTLNLSSLPPPFFPPSFPS